MRFFAIPRASRTALAIAFLALGGGAFAAEEDTTFLLQNSLDGIPGVYDQLFPISNTVDINGVTATRIMGDTFVDDFLFDVLDAQTFYLSLNTDFSGLTQDVSFDSVSVLDFNGDSYSFKSQYANSAGFFGSGLSLATGLYDIEVTGTINANGATYGGVLTTVNPVPEPAEWALMFMGLGVVGAVTRLRARQSA